MVYGTVEAYQVVNPATGKHFGGSLGEIPGLGDMGYIAMTAFAAQPGDRGRAARWCSTLKVSNGRDETTPGDYFADAGDPRVEKDKARARREATPRRELAERPCRSGGTIIE